MTFIERDGIVSMEAEHFAANESKDGKEWKCLKEYGKTLSSMKVYRWEQTLTNRARDQVFLIPF